MIQDTRTRRAIRRRERLAQRLVLGLTRGLAGLVAVVVLAASALVFAPAANAGTDDYPAQWKNAPIDSTFDTWLEYNRECTSFVAWRLHSRNGFEMPFHNDATGWADDARARGYTVDMNPTVGAVAWWAYGHLAWVESVNPGGTVTVEAYNWRTVTGGHDGAYHESTYSASAPSGYIHFKDSGSGVHSGDFVSYRGDVYRIAGGAPIYVSNWATFGGVKPTIALSDSQWAGLRPYPADGTLVSAQPSQQVFTIVGGAPLYISDWATVGGAKPTVSIGDDDIQNAGSADAASPWNHLRFHPSDGTFVAAQPSQRVYQVTGGAPSYVSDWASVGGVQPVTNVGDDVIRNAGTPDHASQWSHLRQRLFGADRFETSAALSAWRFSSGVSTVYVANGFNFPDALSGAALAGGQGTSVLLVTADAIPAAIEAELTRLKPRRIVVLGGEDAVSASVAEQLATFTTGGVVRIAGLDRYETSAAISLSGFAPARPVVYVANGSNFPDALSGAPVAGSQGAPVLLVQEDVIPAAIATELTRLKPGRIVVLGGESSVGASVVAQLGTFTTGAAGAVTRIAGDDRFATSAAISAATFAPGLPVVYLASGSNFPDALSGAAVAGDADAPILLTRADNIPAVVQAELNRLRPGKIVVLGGENSVNSAILP
ncbi:MULTISPECIES: cell wall-binding repeat-containing protein [unclassified Cryobacterium]|uniref:cell wall-binding repeat-containing protein n=1 Tax=unclassified Cryobacterium TaxID=2649013 RepID=UPI002AB55A53|nr:MULTISPECIES: cell wall-binding repeat-containing protein [unclassified Cryobacterium]MDY7542551.1 cell wall-binding repeat-containing protein [Cryobacterium sp. 5B3]MEB0264672.1 cell wall-binding repeat-containing protein [Cryobacterium sp. 10I5]MEB0275170.1 cell wall-binding repeat-containing protein [Cryobacterium sp. 5B3]